MLILSSEEKSKVIIRNVRSIIRKMPRRYKSIALQALEQTISVIGINLVARNIESNELEVCHLLWDIVYAEDFYGVNNYVIGEIVQFVSIIQGQPLTIPECYEISKQIKA